MVTQESIERGVALFQELIGEIPELEEEFESSQPFFLPIGNRAIGPAQRRHLEWFLFERPSNHLGGVPVEVLWERWRQRAAGEDAANAETFLQTVSGAFEVTSSEGGTVWIQDLFALGEYPIDEPDAANELRPGDLLVGRLFPAGEGIFRMSPAVMCFRDERLLRAVRVDLARMRAERRGVLRIEQVELERLFFAPQAAGATEDATARAPSAEAPLEVLRAAGLDAATAERAIERVRNAGEGSIVTEVLNELAFTSDVDLERARRVLLEVHASRPEPSGAERPAPAPVEDPREALAAFDRGRAAGLDLEELFSTLARDLGVGSLDDDEEDGGGADFPQVVDAMVEEFLWETETEQGASAAAPLAPVRWFARFAADQSVFENLGARDVLDYGARWMLDECGREDPSALRAALEAFARFCAWSEERHGVALASALEPFREGLFESVPRLARMRAALREKREDDELFEVVARVASRLELRSLPGGRALKVLGAERLPDLRVGEIVRGAVDGERLEPSGVYPRELRALFELVRGSD